MNNKKWASIKKPKNTFFKPEFHVIICLRIKFTKVNMQKRRFHHAYKIIFFTINLMFGLLSQTCTAQIHANAVKGLLWEVRADKNSHPLYLYGSIHLGNKDFYPLATPVETAFQQATDLVVEADITNEESSKEVIALLSYSAPDSLENHLKPATWQAFQSLIKIGIEDVKKLKPVLLATAFTVSVATQAGFLPQYGVDQYFLERVKKGEKKNIVELEGAVFQGKLLASLTDEEGDELLSQTLTELKTGQIVQELTELVNAWKNGDEKNLEAIFSETASKDIGSQKMMQLLLDDRNISMADKIKRLSDKNISAFVVIGAGHLVGSNSVVSLMKQKGLQLKRIQ
jgi:hypothetical protein